MPTRPPSLAARTEALLARHWWQPGLTPLVRLLQPLAWCYGMALRWHQARHPLPPTGAVPIVVVGNVVVGGAGKTPVVIALVRALQAAGWRPGVVSRGYGRSNEALPPAVRRVQAASLAAQVGDEPLLIHRRTGAPVFVARDRAAAVRELCREHPAVDVVVSDDGLQHRGLARALEVLVFDERGIGNGLLLPAGPLRQPMPPAVGPRMHVICSGSGTPPLQPALQVRRQLGPAWPLHAWWQGDTTACQPMAALRGRPLLALAGLAAPEKFYAMLEAAGLQIERLPQPDHAAYDTAPWPAGTPEVVTTEKDAVKLPPEVAGQTRVWVLGLDLELPAEWVHALSQQLREVEATAAEATAATAGLPSHPSSPTTRPTDTPHP